jgi:hypothetical protein
MGPGMNLREAAEDWETIFVRKRTLRSMHAAVFEVLNGVGFSGVGFSEC